MKGRYPHYYIPSCAQLKEEGKTALFVFDANALISILRLSPAIADKTISVISKLRKRIFIPSHVDLEYHKHILDTPVKMSNSVNECIKAFTFDKIQAVINEVFVNGSKGKKIPADCLEKFTQGLERAHNEIIEELKELRSHYDQLFNEQSLQYKLSDILGDRVLPGFTEEEITAIEQEGERRYEQGIPPGYEDKDKDNGNAYGDLIIWKELLELASKNRDKSIFFISNDCKADWLCIVHNRTWGPRNELIAEFAQRSEKVFYIYTLDQFLKHFGDKVLDDNEIRVISEMQAVPSTVMEVKQSNEKVGNSKAPQPVYHLYDGSEKVPAEKVIDVKTVVSDKEKDLKEINVDIKPQEILKEIIVDDTEAETKTEKINNKQ